MAAKADEKVYGRHSVMRLFSDDIDGGTIQKRK